MASRSSWMRRSASARASAFGSRSWFCRSALASASRRACWAWASARAVRPSRPSSSASAMSHSSSWVSSTAPGWRWNSRLRATRSPNAVVVSFSKPSGLAARASSARRAASRDSGATERSFRMAAIACATGWLKLRSGRMRSTVSEAPSCSAPSRATRRSRTGRPAHGCAERSGCATPRAWRGVPGGSGRSCDSGGASGRAVSTASKRSATTPQSSSARQGSRTARPRWARAGASGKLARGGESAWMARFHSASGVPSRLRRSRPAWVSGACAAKLLASSARKAMAPAGPDSSGAAPARPETATCS